MVRVRTNVATKRRKKRVLKAAKGYFQQRHKRYAQARRTRIKAQAYSYRDRKVRKGEFRKLWTVRINAACREAGMTYSRFISGLIKAKVALDRKMIAELAISSPAAFKRLVKIAQEHVVTASAPKTAVKK
jgi:large subunit ribosomal protein L20